MGDSVMAFTRTIVALGAAVALYFIVKKVFLALSPVGWDRSVIVYMEVILFAVVAGSLIATELVRLAQTLSGPPIVPPVHVAIDIRDLLLLLASMAASFLLAIALLAIARAAGEPFH
jgi:hypothetical protein